MKNVKETTPEATKKTLGILNKDGTTKTIYVGNLSYQRNAYEIKDLFKEFGKINYIRVVFDKKTKKNTGIAFVQMADNTVAEMAIKKLNGALIDGRTLKVSQAVEGTVKKPNRRKRF